MPDNTVRPKWWQLYLTFPLLIMLFVLDHNLDLSEGGHSAVQIGTLLLIYGLDSIWIKKNTGALSDLDQKPYGEAIVVTRSQTFHMPEMKSNEHQEFSLPRPGLKGTMQAENERGSGKAKYPLLKEAPKFMTKEY